METDWISSDDIHAMQVKGAKLRRAEWRKLQDKSSREPAIFVEDFDDSLECLRLSHHVQPLPGAESEHLRRLVAQHGFPAVLRSLYLLAYERERDAQMLQEIQLDAPDVEPFAVFACKLDELAGSQEAGIK